MINPNDKTNSEEITTTHALEYYKNHCEFLGYSVEYDGDYSIICTHSRKSTLSLFLLNHDVGVLARVLYFMPEKFINNLMPLYAYANELNYNFNYMKAYIREANDGTPFIILSSVLEGDYNRKNFAIFLENIDQDLDKFHSYPKTRDIWKSQEDE